MQYNPAVGDIEPVVIANTDRDHYQLNISWMEPTAADLRDDPISALAG